MKTQSEIDELKRQWKADPCWDIYETDGFEEYRTELLTYQVTMQAEWNRIRTAQLNRRAAELGCSVELVRYIERLEYRLNALETQS